MTRLYYFMPWPIIRHSLLLLEIELMNSFRLFIAAGQSQSSGAWGRL